jgi:hypothetical protein
MEGRAMARPKITSENLDDDDIYGTQNDTAYDDNDTSYSESDTGTQKTTIFVSDEMLDNPNFDEYLKLSSGRKSGKKKIVEVTGLVLDVDDDYENQNENEEGKTQQSYSTRKIPREIDGASTVNDEDEASLSSSLSKRKRSNKLTSCAVSRSGSSKKPKSVSIDELLIEYTYKREQQAEEAATEVRRHNKAMETIAQSTATIETTKKNLEIGVLTKAAALDNEKKEFELKMQRFNTYEEMKKKGITDARIFTLFPSLKEFGEDN